MGRSLIETNSNDWGELSLYTLYLSLLLSCLLSHSISYILPLFHCLSLNYLTLVWCGRATACTWHFGASLISGSCRNGTPGASKPLGAACDSSALPLSAHSCQSASLPVSSYCAYATHYHTQRAQSCYIMGERCWANRAGEPNVNDCGMAPGVPARRQEQAKRGRALRGTALYAAHLKKDMTRTAHACGRDGSRIKGVSRGHERTALLARRAGVVNGCIAHRRTGRLVQGRVPPSIALPATCTPFALLYYRVFWAALRYVLSRYPTVADCGSGTSAFCGGRCPRLHCAAMCTALATSLPGAMPQPTASRAAGGQTSAGGRAI